MSGAATSRESGHGVLDGYLSRSAERWRGFPALSFDELARHYTFSDGEGRARRGEDRIDYRFRALARPGFRSPFLFHFAGDWLAFIETDYWSLDAGTCAQTLAALGPPPQRLEAHFRDAKVPQGEWLYAGAGLALCVMPDTGLIARWTAFAPMSGADYCRSIRVTDHGHEFPEVRG